LITVRIETSESKQGYLSLAENALSEGSGEEAYEYANKALEFSADSSSALILKMKALETMGTIRDPRIAEVISCGKYAVGCASDDEKQSVTDEVYAYFLVRAFGLISLATAQVNDTKQVNKLFEAYSAVNIFSAASNTEKDDAEALARYINLTTAALALIAEVPDDAIKENLSLEGWIALAIEKLSQFFLALDMRLKIYGTKAADEALEERTRQLTALIYLLSDEKKIELLKKHQSEQSAKWREKGLCRNCGGKLSRLSDQCKECGKQN